MTGECNNWQGDNPCAGWNGIWCNDIGGVTSINFEGYYNTYAQCSGTLDFSILPSQLSWLRIVHTSLGGTVDLSGLPSSMTSVVLSQNHFSGTVDLSHLPASLTSFDISYNSFSSIIFGDAIMRSTSNEHGLAINNNPWTCPMPALPLWLAFPGCTGTRVCLLQPPCLLLVCSSFMPQPAL